MQADLDAQVRRVDEDRWLASRFAAPEVRARLIALYAFNDEIARTVEVVSQPALGDIRLAWWRGGIAEIYEGKSVRAHPVLQALAALRGDWERAALEALIDARARDLDAAPFPGWTSLDAYLGETAGGVMRLALQACGADLGNAVIADAARAWGCVAWMRARRALPVGESNASLIARARAAHSAVRRASAALPAAAFPAIGYVALAPRYLRALEKSERDTPLLLRQLNLVVAAATGRL